MITLNQRSRPVVTGGVNAALQFPTTTMEYAMNEAMTKVELFGKELLASLRTEKRKSREGSMFIPAIGGNQRPVILKISYEGFADEFTCLDFDDQYVILQTVIENRLKNVGDSVIVAGEKHDDPSTRLTRLNDMEKWSARVVLVTRA